MGSTVRMRLTAVLWMNSHFRRGLYRTHEAYSCLVNELTFQTWAVWSCTVIVLYMHNLCFRISFLVGKQESPSHTFSGDGNLHGSGMSHAMTASPKPSFRAPRRMGAATLWSAEIMLDGQHERVVTPLLLPELLMIASRRKDWKRISAEWLPHVPPMTQSVKGLRWTSKCSKPGRAGQNTVLHPILRVLPWNLSFQFLSSRIIRLHFSQSPFNVKW